MVGGGGVKGTKNMRPEKKAVNIYLFITEKLTVIFLLKKKSKYKSVIATTTDLPEILIYLFELALLSHVYI